MLKLTNNINLIVCCYGGNNRWHESSLAPSTNVSRNPEIGSGCISYLKKQVFTLANLKHKLRQITFVVNDPGKSGEVEGYSEVLDSIPKIFNSTKIEVIRRGNHGESLGAFSQVVKTYKDSFKYYCFMEDDWVFVKDEFDDILIDQLESKPKCELLVAYRKGDIFCSNAIIRSESLRRFEFDMPYNGSNDYKKRKIKIPIENVNFARESTYQSTFLAPFKICTLDHPYGTMPYFGISRTRWPNQKMLFHLPGSGNEYIMVPAQMIKENSMDIVEPTFRIDAYC